MLFFYRATRFEIIPSVFPNCQFNIPPELWHNSCGCRKSVQILQSCRDYQGEPHKFYFEVLKIKKINKNANLKFPLMCTPLAHLNFSILKCKYILSRREHMSGIRTPHSFKIFSSYPHVYLLNQPFYRQQKWHNQATIQNGTQIICASGRGTISNFYTTCMLALNSADTDMKIST